MELLVTGLMHAGPLSSLGACSSHEACHLPFSDVHAPSPSFFGPSLLLFLLLVINFCFQTHPHFSLKIDFDTIYYN